MMLNTLTDAEMTSTADFSAMDEGIHDLLLNFHWEENCNFFTKEKTLEKMTTV